MGNWCKSQLQKSEGTSTVAFAHFYSSYSNKKSSFLDYFGRRGNYILFYLYIYDNFPMAAFWSVLNKEEAPTDGRRRRSPRCEERAKSWLTRKKREILQVRVSLSTSKLHIFLQPRPKPPKYVLYL
jgi:hypothetical protein